MSYCRWSSDNYKSDVYLFEAGDGVYCLYVAKSRYVDIDNIPRLKPFIEYDSSGNFLSDYMKQNEWLKSAKSEIIDNPCAGGAYYFSDLESCYSKLVELKEAGFHVPEYLFDTLKHEIKNVEIQ